MNRRDRMQIQLALFLRQYGRKRQKGADPNDRPCSRKVARKMRQMDPEFFDQLRRGDESPEEE